MWNVQDVTGTEGREGEGTEEGTEVAVSISTLTVPALDDKPVSRSLNLTLDPKISLLKTSHTDLNQAKD